MSEVKLNIRDANRADQPYVVWDRSDLNTGAVGDSPSLSLMAQSTRLAELIQSLKEAGADLQTIGALNRSFDTLRDAFDKMVETLDQVRDRNPTLEIKCDDLKQQFIDFGKEQNHWDSEVPF